jgi:FixJ family two-component response regulator
MDTEQKTVALIDDDPVVRKALKRFLRASGFVVQTFASRDEFLGAAIGFSAHCLVLDVDLGACSGFDVAEHPLVMALGLPIVMMSGSSDEAHRIRAEALGCVAFLGKPFPPQELLDAIAKAVDR